MDHPADNRHGWPMTGKDAITETFYTYFNNNNFPDTYDEYMARPKNPKITPAERIKLTEYWLSRDRE